MSVLGRTGFAAAGIVAVGTVVVVALAFSNTGGSCDPSCADTKVLAGILALGSLGSIAGGLLAWADATRHSSARRAAVGFVSLFFLSSFTFLLLSFSSVALFYMVTATVIAVAALPKPDPHGTSKADSEK
jgi:hypothetical protein